MEDKVSIFYFEATDDTDNFQRDVDRFVRDVVFSKSTFLCALKKTETESRLEECGC